MNKNRKTIVIGCVVLVGVFMAWKTLNAVGLLLGIGLFHPPVQAAVNFGPYPYPQDVDLGWHDPATMVNKAQDLSQGKAVRNLRAKVLEEAGQDPEKAMQMLFERRKDPEGSQALFDAMRELASGGKAPMGEGKPGEPLAPLFKAEGNRGVAAVARMAQQLADAKASGKASRFDGLLLEDAIRLMGHYGTGSRYVEGAAQEKSADVDPVTRGVLRQFLQVNDGAIQALSSRALGQLGDLETAKELMRNPKKYPSASISDFGPEAVRLFQESQTGKMAKGTYSDADMWQSMRLRPKDQDVAETLAGMGDPGAGMAAARNWVLETMSGSVDQKLYQRLDIMLRFPNTPRAKGALEIVSIGVPDAPWDRAIYRPFMKTPEGGPDARLTSMALLALLDREFAILFSGKPFNPGGSTPIDLPIIQRLIGPIAAMQEQFLEKPFNEYKVTPESQAQIKAFLEGVRRIYMKHFKPNAFGWVGFHFQPIDGRAITQEDKDDDIRAWKRGAYPVEDKVLISVCYFAHRLGLPKPDWSRKKYILEGLREHQPAEGAWR